MMEIDNSKVLMAAMQVETLLDEALDNTHDITYATGYYTIARGYLKCLKDLDLLTRSERERLTWKLLNLSDRIESAKEKMLNEVGKLSSAD
jgi:hypothetical protein